MIMIFQQIRQTFFVFLAGYIACYLLSPYHYQIDHIIRPSSNDSVIKQKNDYEETEQNRGSFNNSRDNVLLKQTGSTNVSHYQVFYPESHACSLFGRDVIPSAVTIWRKHLSKIFISTLHKFNSGSERHHDFTARLLNYMSPERLQKSVKVLPFQYWNNVGIVLDIIYRRWKWIDSGKPSDQPEPRKVNVMVFGGSVTMGINCGMNPMKKDYHKHTRKYCAWVYRLKTFVSSITGKDLVEFQMMAMGGTNTGTAYNLYEYSAFPSGTTVPDIIIHAYSTNDMHIQTIREAEKLNISLEKQIFQMNEQFIRSVLSTSSAINNDGTQCETAAPLLLYYDDYIGNEQKEIYQTYAFSRAVSTLAAYYGFGSSSYADVVRDFVFSNTDETWFSPDGWPERQIHPGIGMHISSVWILAFNFLTMATTYCEMPIAMNLMDEHRYKPIHGLPLLKNDTFEIHQHPLPRPSALPPKLGENLSLDNVTEIWQEAGTINNIIVEAKNVSKCDINKSLRMPRSCLFSWIGNSIESDVILKNKIQDIIMENHHWHFSDDNKKSGYLAEQNNASFIMKLSDIHHPVITLNFMTMTSYGKNWEGSKIYVNAMVYPKDTEIGREEYVSMNISGYHSKNTSEIFVHQLKLNKMAELGDTLLVNVRLIGGVTFKITGMAFCDH